MHKFSMPEEIIGRVVARVGRTHPFDKLEASKTAFVVIDIQSDYLKPGYLGDVPLARGIVPTRMVPQRCWYQILYSLLSSVTPLVAERFDESDATGFALPICKPIFVVLRLNGRGA